MKKKSSNKQSIISIKILKWLKVINKFQKSVKMKEMSAKEFFNYINFLNIPLNRIDGFAFKTIYNRISKRRRK